MWLHNEHEKSCLHDSLETARRALLHQQGQFLAATHIYEAAARPNLVITLASNSEVHNCNVQIQVRQLEQEADANVHKDRRDMFFDYLRQIKPLKICEKNLVTEVTSEVWRRDQQVYELRTELSLQARHQTLRNIKVKNTLDCST